MARVLLQDVAKRYPDGTEAVSALTLEVADGELLLLAGPSGSGKSTVLRMVAGLEEIGAGEVVIGERVVNALTTKERNIAMVFQNYELYPHMTVAENMGFALRLAKVDPEEIEARVAEAAGILGLTDCLGHKPASLSAAQRQRVAMGRAVVRSPQALLMDEPLSNLDATLRVRMRDEIAALHQRLGVTTIYATGDHDEAVSMGDRVAVLERGVLRQVAPPTELYEHPETLFVAAFIGSPSMNIAEARLDRRDDGHPVVHLGALEIGVPEQAFERYPALRESFGRTLAAGIRPEDVVGAEDSELAPDQRFPVEVAAVETVDSEVLLRFPTGAPPVVDEHMRSALDDDEAFERLRRSAHEGQMFTARLATATPPEVGETIELGVRAGRMHFFDLDTGRALR